MERERERSRGKAKARSQGQGSAEEQVRSKEPSRARSAQPDKRLARIVAQGSGQYQTYDPGRDKTGRGGQNREFLDKLIKTQGSGSPIQKLDDGRYQIDRFAALQAIRHHSAPQNSVRLSDKVAKEFRFKGERQRDGSLVIDPGKLLKNSKQNKFHNTLVNRLEEALANGERGLTQMEDGRYRLYAASVKSDKNPAAPRERVPAATVDQRLARIVGTDTGRSMVYDPMQDSSGQVSKNTQYLEQLSKKHSFVEKAADGCFLIDRHAANQELSKTYKAADPNKELDPKIVSLFYKHGSKLEIGVHAIDPKRLLENEGQHYQRVVNSLEKGLRQGAKGLNKTEDGTYLLSINMDDSKGPSLTPSANWEHWRNVNQRDSLKAQLAASPLNKEQQRGPAPSMSPAAQEKDTVSGHYKLEPLKTMQDEREQKRNQDRQNDQALATQRRQKLEQQLAAEQARLNQDFKRNWRAEGVLNAEMQYRRNKNQQPLKAGNDLSPSTRREYLKIARRLEKIHPLQMPEYLKIRADQVSRQTWWKEHAVARRMLRSAEADHFSAGETRQGKELAASRQAVQQMNYKSHRTQESTPSHSKRESRFSENFYSRLLDRAKSRGDQELHDALVITRTTGLRPAELQKGVHFGQPDRANNEVTIHIQGAKKSRGIEDAPYRYQGDHGEDRILRVRSADLVDVAERNNGYFKPESSKDALRRRLTRATTDLDPNNEHQFAMYTLRHQAADDMREQGYSPQDIALHMGHKSERTQQEYGITQHA